jgi:signal transduction histidine kinase
MRFTAKLVLGSALVCALAIAMGTVFLFAFKRYQRANHLVFLLEQVRNAEQTLQSALLQEIQAVQDQLEHPGPVLASRAQELARQSAELIKRVVQMDQTLVRDLRDHSFPLERLRYFAGFQGELSWYEAQYAEIGRLVHAGPGAERERARRLADDAERGIRARIAEMDQSWGKNIGQVLASIQRDRDRAVALLAVLLATALSVSLGVTIWVATSLRRYLGRLVEGMRHVAAGDYGRPIPLGRDPELNEVVAHFNRMAADLKGLEEMRRDFISMLSHDLKSPLAVIKMYAERLGAQERAASREAQVISRSADRLLRLVENFLDASRAETAQLVLDLRPLRLEPLLESVREDGEMLAQPYKLKVVLDAAPRLPEVIADEAHLERALHNLVSNAIKYNRPEGTVTIRAAARGGTVRLEVEDTGVGFADEDLGRLFEKYFRAEGTRRIRGTGLGLAVTREIVRAHGGELEVRSRAGEGSVFGFNLPAAAVTVLVSKDERTIN